jgi:cytochrome c553
MTILAASALHAAAATTTPAAAPKISPADQQFFENKIRPVLVESCYKCHSRDADKVKGGLMLDTREALLHGGSSGDAIVPGNPDKSLLIQAIRYTDEDLQMPPKGNKLSDQQIADLTEWVRRGAPDPRALVAKGSSAAYAGVGKDHWSFLPMKKPAVPTVANAAWCQTPVDNFILQKLEGAQLAPNPAADRRTLIRRVSFDLIGLPPTEADVNAFVADPSPNAYAKVVDRLLASPQYGERWGRYWLDVARYADTKGDPPKRDDPRYPHAWTYRDWVINAFNTDKPFNQFIIDQLAADRVLEDTVKKNKVDPKKADQSNLAALGFLTLGNQFDGNVHDVINDRIDVTTKAFLGLTVSCARCHDHKFDPIPTKDYYSLYGIFANTFEPKSMKDEPTIKGYPLTPELQAYLNRLGELDDEKSKLEADYIEFKRSRTRDRDKLKELQKRETQIQREAGDLESSPAAPARANVLVDLKTTKDYPVLIRGEAQNKGDIVPRHFLTILAGSKPPTYKNGSGRLDLAKDIASPTNPLTARVFVNRIWQEHFGAGFVATPDDLGNMSSPPTHPELLDYLASRFVESGWSVKALHRLIVLSAVYQESGAPNANAAYADTDPDNKLLWRYNLRRLDFEEVHDSLLAIAGTLDLTMGGKSIPIGSSDFATRRAVYTYIDRRNPAEILTQFDFPNPSVPTGRRYETIVPQQSLFMMNSPLVIETARKLTHRPDFTQLSSDEERVASLYLAIFQRPPSGEETKACLSYVEKNPGGTSMDAPAAKPAAIEAGNRAAQRQARVAELAAKGSFGKNAPQIEPAAAAFKSRAPLDAWTKLAHALFQTNEAMFFN